MGRVLIVSKVGELQEYKKIAEEFQVSFEINDFYDPVILDHEEQKNDLIKQYLENSLPKESNLHGAFYDLVLFSQDEKIREISRLRMIQSMEIARTLGIKGVVFHTNYNPTLSGEIYDEQAITQTVSFMRKLLEQFKELEIYLENMFDADPNILSCIAKELSSYENFGVCLDYAHASISKTDPEVWLRQLGPYIKHFHINDNDLVRDLHNPLGSGKIKWDSFFKEYREHFSKCSLLIETTRPMDQRVSLEYLQKNYPEVLQTNLD